MGTSIGLPIFKNNSFKEALNKAASNFLVGLLENKCFLHAYNTILGTGKRQKKIDSFIGLKDLQLITFVTSLEETIA